MPLVRRGTQGGVGATKRGWGRDRPTAPERAALSGTQAGFGVGACRPRTSPTHERTPRREAGRGARKGLLPNWPRCGGALRGYARPQRAAQFYCLFYFPFHLQKRRRVQRENAVVQLEECSTVRTDSTALPAAFKRKHTRRYAMPRRRQLRQAERAVFHSQNNYKRSQVRRAAAKIIKRQLKKKIESKQRVHLHTLLSVFFSIKYSNCLCYLSLRCTLDFLRE